MKTRVIFVPILLAILILCTMSAYALPEQSVYAVPQNSDSVGPLFDYSYRDISNIHIQESYVSYVLHENEIVCFDKKENKEKCFYSAKYDIQLVVPYLDKGLMFGSALPTDSDGTPLNILEYQYGLRWSGKYEYLDYATGNVIQIDDPDLFYYAVSSGIQEVDWFSNTINGRQVPLYDYPNGSTWQSSIYYGNFDSGYQCMGFASYVYDALFGTSGSKIYQSGITPTQSFLTNLPLGSLIRVNDNYQGLVPHSMILIGRDSGGVYIYHANWPSNNIVATSYVTWSQFANTFQRVNYYICPHNVQIWRYYSPYMHYGTCVCCGQTCYGTHYASVAGTNVRCLACGYQGSMAGLTSIEEIQ